MVRPQNAHQVKLRRKCATGLEGYGTDARTVPRLVHPQVITYLFQEDQNLK